MSPIQGDHRTTCALKRDTVRCAIRQSWTPLSSDCRACEFLGRKARAVNGIPPAREQQSPIREHKPLPRETIRPVNGTIHPKKEEGTVTTKEKIVERIEKDGGRCSASRLRAFVQREDFNAALSDLVAEGKVRKDPGRFAGTLAYALPSVPAPPEGAKLERPAPPAPAAPSNDATKASKRIGRVNRASAAGRKPAPGSSLPKNGGGRTQPSGPRRPADGSYQLLIADLTAQRDRLDVAIAALQALS